MCFRLLQNMVMNKNLSLKKYLFIKINFLGIPKWVKSTNKERQCLGHVPASLFQSIASALLEESLKNTLLLLLPTTHLLFGWRLVLRDYPVL